MKEKFSWRAATYTHERDICLLWLPIPYEMQNVVPSVEYELELELDDLALVLDPNTWDAESDGARSCCRQASRAVAMFQSKVATRVPKTSEFPLH